MGDQNQSQGRDDNGAAPTDQWQSKGVSGDKTAGSDAAKASAPTTQPYGVDPDESVERTGRTEEVTGERRSFSGDTAKAAEADPNDLTGPAGDPVEGKRSGPAAGA